MAERGPEHPKKAAELKPAPIVISAFTEPPHHKSLVDYMEWDHHQRPDNPNGLPITQDITDSAALEHYRRIALRGR